MRKHHNIILKLPIKELSYTINVHRHDKYLNKKILVSSSIVHLSTYCKHCRSGKTIQSRWVWFWNDVKQKVLDYYADKIL